MDEMMQKIFIVTALVLVGATSASAQEDPVITVTSGGLVADVNVADGNTEHVGITLKGRQFYLSGHPDDGGVFGPHPLACACLPGETYPLNAVWVGSDFSGYFKVGKTVYPFQGTYTGEFGTAYVGFYGQWQAPLFDGRTERKVTAPFTFEGIAMTPFDAVSGLATTYFLQGTGKATLFFVWNSDEGRWLLESAKYQFTR